VIVDDILPGQDIVNDHVLARQFSAE
jgi:hypothetical protein